MIDERIIQVVTMNASRDVLPHAHVVLDLWLKAKKIMLQWKLDNLV